MVGGGVESREVQREMWVFVKMGCEEKIGGEEGWHSKMGNGTWRGCVGIELD